MSPSKQALIKNRVNKDGRVYADLRDVEDFASRLPDKYLQCREMGHTWRPYTAGKYKDGGFRRTLRCSRCYTRKTQDVSARGLIVRSYYEHPEGYSFTGHGMIVGEGRGLLRLASIMRLEPDLITEED